MVNQSLHNERTVDPIPKLKQAKEACFIVARLFINSLLYHL